ncbi:uncharacterized protein TRIVIDRAFT_71185 [Trichoderma virens Gv29-8]|uniref:Rhodopsin domain-containing protein n=1 Tax=Hypocrea virens (strain Gv29-8 / FGSC 10586) TaxID=413071 RepID=G9MRN6_HYPVG|nr:uncharacterized protein TRIVIDRAFT_71185 [Trichoderma virens Gv29-8]EHK23197.1 hypothetical protein TRIVIDRAFT_71185 [Trichoderma virens Gv29-8]UKZ47811.1 hypothetical protein TrVGV298_002041 [Trichoderma virens]UKZ74367.1 hypothetical protein TrVFT333_002033 [Trichoderma virens FT-333]
MSYPGAAPPPEGVIPDLAHPQDVLRTVNYVTQALTIFFVTIFVAIRYYAKSRVLGGGFTSDDYATYSAYVLMIGYCITACFAGSHGGGLNIWDVSKEEVEKYFKSCYAATIFYAPMAMTVKLALLIIIIRVFGSVHRRTLIGIYIFIGMIVAYYVSGFFIKIFICWPISAYWTGDASKCMNQSAIVTADSIISVISDLAILLLPTPLTWSLQLPRRKRLRVAGLLCAGGVATAFSIYRLAMIVDERNSPNMTMVFIKVILSGNAEAGIGLICACLPAVSALYVQRTRGSSYFKNPGHSSITGRGEIMLTRSYHVDRSAVDKDVDESALELGHDEAGLVSNMGAQVKANAPESHYSNRSEETL